MHFVLSPLRLYHRQHHGYVDEKFIAPIIAPYSKKLDQIKVQSRLNLLDKATFTCRCWCVVPRVSTMVCWRGSHTAASSVLTSRSSESLASHSAQ